jgi:tetratricopeptide (TPR) repeat protein
MTTLAVPRLHRPGLRPVVVLAAVAIVVIGSYGTRTLTAAPASKPPVAAPSASSGDAAADVAALAASAGLEQLDKSIGIWTGNLRRDAKDFIAATNLAILYNARGRLTANIDDYGRALEAAKAAVAAAPKDPGGRLAETTVLLAIHDFGGALSLGSEIYREDPAQLGALAATGDAQQELGDYDAARATFQKLAGLTAGAAIDARLGRFAYLTGDAATGLRLASRARDEGTSAEAVADDPGSGVYYHYQLGEMARLTGDATLAVGEYEAALSLRPTDLGSLIGLAKVQAFEGRPTDAVATLRRATAIAPQPEALALLGDLLASSGDAAGAARQYATIRQISRLSALSGSVYDRLLLQFELDHGGATDDLLARARAALAERQDAYGHDVVAWALYRLGRFDEAATEAAAAQSAGIVDARIMFHAGAIAIARGDAEAGRAQVAGALALGPALDSHERTEAQALVR